MLKENDLEKIERYVNGLADDNEKAWVESLFLSGEDNYTLRHSLEKDWDIMLRDTSLSEVNLSHLLDRVHHIIRKNKTLKRQKPLQKFIRIYMKAATILLLPLLNAWTGGKLVFRGDLMAEVGRRIERWYNVKIELADRELEKYSFRATFEDDKLEEILRLLSMTSPIRYSITSHELMQDRNYKKEEVTIYLK